MGLAKVKEKTNLDNFTQEEKHAQHPTQYEMFVRQLKDERIDNLEKIFTEKINATNDHINATKNELTEKIHSVHDRINSTNDRIDALDEKLTEKINSNNSKMNLMLVFMGIGFSGLFALFGVMLSKMM